MQTDRQTDTSAQAHTGRERQRQGLVVTSISASGEKLECMDVAAQSRELPYTPSVPAGTYSWGLGGRQRDLKAGGFGGRPEESSVCVLGRGLGPTSISQNAFCFLLDKR